MKNHKKQKFAKLNLYIKCKNATLTFNITKMNRIKAEPLTLKINKKSR